jgi:hypothetical protein
MVVIGIDPHKGSHTAVAIDEDETKLDEVRVRADRRQLEALQRWAAAFPERSWAIESANGLGALLSQQLVGVGEEVFDVPPTLSSRVRVLASGKSQKNDPNDAFSVAVAALRSSRLRVVVAEDQIAVLRLLWNRHKNLTSHHTQAVCRLHALLGRHRPRWGPSTALCRSGRRGAVGVPGQDGGGEGEKDPSPRPHRRCPSPRRAAEGIQTRHRRGGVRGAHVSRRALGGGTGGHLHHPGPHR